MRNNVESRFTAPQYTHNHPHKIFYASGSHKRWSTFFIARNVKLSSCGHFKIRRQSSKGKKKKLQNKLLFLLWAVDNCDLRWRLIHAQGIEVNLSDVGEKFCDVSALTIYQATGRLFRFFPLIFFVYFFVMIWPIPLISTF